MKKTLIIIAFYSRKFINILWGISLLVITIMSGISQSLSNEYLLIFSLLTGIFIGMNLMIWIIKFLNKNETKRHPFFMNKKQIK